MASAEYVAAVLADSPVAFWELQDASGNPVDSSGNGFDCDSVSGTPDYHQAGPMDDFSIHCAATEKLNRTTQVSTLVNDMSMELWIYPIAVTASGRTVFGNGFTGSTGWGIAIEIDGRFKSEISDGAAVGNPSVAYLPFSEWSHIGVVRNEGDWNYYRNGVTDSLANGPGAPGVPAGPVQIGAGSGLDLNFAYMAVYDSILEEADFARHYAARTTGPSIAWTTA